MIDIEIHKTLGSSVGSLKLQIETSLVQGSFTTIFGVSGSGKTSMLRILAGLLALEKGKITFNDNVWLDTSRNINLKPQQRKIGFVFQDYALFPNMTVRENLLYACAKNSDRKIIDELIEIMELRDLQNRKSEMLSGGQKQRVAIARALVNKPLLLMLDEPLAALDISLRRKLQDYLLEIHKQYKLTTLMVSHDASEIIKMSERVLVLDQGIISKDLTPVELFSSGEVSGKFKFSGELIEIVKQDFVTILSILIGNDLIKVVADEEEIEGLRIGDKVLVASKAFNPIIKKID
ncbi:MAG: ATP-binding cassette domain-containing protein [Bacteroidetes bacterium]|nr:MAG: ATP-binding cassette domain-containing protein [Bacteroidota bacterium]MBL1145768.1 ATP-binding cassette domain-containing protein [Bacteroidota bacterium]MCB0803916.1 ATP-binding cassette domain-containing protein [Flavobacteriales bacterium]NOG58562.1 ATP-binding cassette domain-containing protein [Bacteroidota bacterium]